MMLYLYLINNTQEKIYHLFNLCFQWILNIKHQIIFLISKTILDRMFFVFTIIERGQKIKVSIYLMSFSGNSLFFYFPLTWFLFSFISHKINILIATQAISRNGSLIFSSFFLHCEAVILSNQIHQYSNPIHLHPNNLEIKSLWSLFANLLPLVTNLDDLVTLLE